MALGVVRDLRAPRSLDGPGITAQDLRVRRLHDEAQASDGAAIRYCAGHGTLDQATARTSARTGR